MELTKWCYDGFVPVTESTIPEKSNNVNFSAASYFQIQQKIRYMETEKKMQDATNRELELKIRDREQQTMSKLVDALIQKK